MAPRRRAKTHTKTGKEVKEATDVLEERLKVSASHLCVCVCVCVCLCVCVLLQYMYMYMI